MESKTIDPDSETNASMNSIFAGQMSTEPVGSGTLHQPMLRSHQECSEMCNTQNVQYAMCKNKESKQNSSNSRTTSRSDTGKKTKNKKDQQKAVKNNSTDCERQNDGAIAASVGVSYQQAIAIVMVCHAAKQLEDDGTFEFTITSEDQQGSKFDDVVCCLPKVKTQILMQAKFKQDNTKKLRFEDIISTENNDFSISKYFKDFQHQKKKSENDKAKDQSRDKKYEVRLLALCTNIGLAEDVEKFVTKYACRDNIVDNFIRSLSDNVYKIDWKGINGNPNRTLLDHLRENSDLYSLAKQLADCICAGKGINFSQPLFEKYRAVVVKIGKGEKPEKEVDEIFFESDDAVSTDFKSIFEDEYCKQLIWQNIKEKGLELVKSAELQENQQNNYLKENTDIYSIAKQLAECIFECDYTNLPPTLYQSVFYEFGNTSKSIKIKKDFFESPDAFATDFKAIFEKEYFKLLIWDDVRKNKFMLDEHKMSEYNLPPIDEDSQIERFLQSFMVVCSARDEKTELTNNSVIAEIAAKVSVECYKVNKDFFKISKAIETYFRNIFENEYGKHLIWKDIRKKRFNYQRDHKRPSEEILPPKVTDIEIQEFVDSFIIVCNTKHDERVVIRNNLENSEYKLIPSDIQGPACEFAYDRLSKWIIKWIQSGKGAILTEQDTKRWFNLIRASLQYFQINELSGIQNHRFQCKNDELMSRKLYKKLESWLSGSNTDVNENFERCNYPPWLVVQVIQFLEEKSKIRLNILFLNADSYKKEEEKVKNVFCTMNFPLILVIDYKGENADLGEFSKWHSQDKSFKKMIITIETSYKPEDAEEKILIDHLTDESRSEITNKSTIFFGTPILYDEIFREEDGLNFVSDVESFPNHSAVKRNIIEENYNEIHDVYIQRKLQQCEMEHDSNYYNASRWFSHYGAILSSVRLHHSMAEKLGREANFDSFLRHLDHYFRLGSYGIENDLSSLKIDFDMKKKVRLIFNEAGIGKSFYVTWLAWQLQSNEDRKDWWIVKLNFIEFSTIFDQMQAKSPKMNELDAIRLFFELTYLVFHLDNKFDPKIKEKWEIAKNISELVLLCEKNINIDKSKLQSLTSEQLVFLRIFVSKFNNNKLFVLMDGFDEIAPDYKDMVLKLLEYLKNFDGICNIFITSRPYDFRKEMADKLGECGYYRLQPLNEKDLFTYTQRFVPARFKSVQLEEEQMQSNIVRMHVRLLLIFLYDIAYIPLFVAVALELLLPIVEKHLNMSYVYPLEMLNDCEQQFARVSMMETFIKNKLITKVEKSGTRTDTVHTKKTLKKDYEEIKKSHSVLGLYAILNKREVGELLSPVQKEEATRYMNELKTGTERSGIVDGVVDEVPIFVHRLFAEYFAALWFFTNVEQDGVINFLKRHVIKRIDMIEIKQFLDRIVCEKNDFHMAVLDSRGSKVKTLLIENPNIINETDFWGRTPLQLAFIDGPKTVYFHKDWMRIVERLLDRTDENEILLKDRYFKWDVTDYAYHWLKTKTNTGDNHFQDLLKKALELEHVLFNEHLQSVQRNRRANFLKYLFTKLTLNLVYEDQLEDINLSTRCRSVDLEKAELLLEITTILRKDFDKKESIMLQILVDNVFLKLEPEQIERFVELALKYRWENVLHCLVKKQITLPDETNFEHELLVLVTYMEHDEKKFREIFHKYCVRHDIPCLEENQLEPVLMAERSEKIILEPLHRVPTEFQFTNTNGIDIGTEFLISRALQTNNLSIVQYLIRKTDTTVNNQLIKRIVQIHRIDCYCENFNFLVERSEDLSGIDVNGQNLLHFAVEQGQFNLVKCLIEHKEFKPADINSKEKNWNAFFYCVVKRDEDYRLREEKMKLNIFKYMMDFTNESPLKCFKLLDSDGKSIFHYAAQNSQLILDYIIWRHFNTPLHEFNEEQIIRLTELFLLSDTDPVGIFKYIKIKHLSNESWCKIICKTLEENNWLQYKDSKGRNLLHIAVREKWLVLAKCLIEHFEFSVEETNKEENDWNVFFYLSDSGASEEKNRFVSYIMDKHPEFDYFNQLDSKGKSVFYYAVMSAPQDYADIIIQRKFGLSLNDFNEDQMIKLLQSSCFDLTEMLKVLHDRDLLNETSCKIICKTLEENNGLQYKDSNGRNLLQLATQNGWFVLGKWLIEHLNFDCNEVNVAENNWNVFFYLARCKYGKAKENSQFFSYIIDKNPDFDCFKHLDSDGNNVFYHAMKNNKRIVDSIIIKEFNATGTTSIEKQSELFLQRLKETKHLKIDVVMFLRYWSLCSALKSKNEIHAKMLSLIETEY